MNGRSWVEPLRETPPYLLLSAARRLRDRWRWGRNAHLVVPPHGVKVWTVREFGRRYGLKHLVETGTLYGEMVAGSLRAFENIHTIELDSSLFEFSARRFSRFRHVNVVHGDSATELPAVLTRLGGAALFWLDAHFSGAGTAKADVETPVWAELESILRDSRYDHVVLIDDAHEFGAGDYPTLDEIRDLIAELRPDYAVTQRSNIIRITPPLGRPVHSSH